MEGIGMAVGSLLWNTVTCVVGWAVTRFGLLGNPRQLPQDNVMNIIGVATVCIGCALLDHTTFSSGEKCTLMISFQWMLLRHN